MIRNWIAGAMVVLMSATLLAPAISEAKRLGGGKSQGMQRTPAQQSPQTPPQTPAAPQPGAPTTSPAAAPAAAGATAAAAQAGKRSWLGPIAGLAAGLGIAALLSHMGFGEGLATFVTIALLALVAFFVIRFLLARFAGGSRTPALASAGAGASPLQRQSPAPTPLQPAAPQAPMARTAEPAAFVPASQDVSVTGQPLAPAALATAPATPAASGPNLPPGFDLPAFERIAKMIFIRLQAANDAGDLDDLRQFTTPEMFAVARLELQERGGVAQHTDVEQVEAKVLDFAVEDGKQIVSVRFHGKVREAEGAAAEAFDEVWHLVKPVDDSRSWAIAGIQQPQ